jgi:predicted dithiol-disulfide oxidoreductase (DUF899 family)
MALPDVVSSEEWLAARRKLLAEEKELTRQQTAVNAERRRLPMVRVEKEYVFEGPDGPRTLGDLFTDSRQLIVKHVMFGPDWDDPCPGCQADVDEMTPAELRHLRSRETAFVLVSRAPYEKIAKAKEARGWFIPWYSSYGTDFNYDFWATLDRERGQLVHNFRTDPDALDGEDTAEMSGISCFIRDRCGDQQSGQVFHTYSTFARGTEFLGGSYTFLDLTVLGRQEDWEEPKDRVSPVRGGDPTFLS